MKKTQFGATILEGHDVADLPLVSQNAQILEDEIIKNRAELEDLKATSGSQEDINKLEESIKELEQSLKQLNFTIVDKADKTEIGELSDLQTENKDNLVSAINEVYKQQDPIPVGKVKSFTVKEGDNKVELMWVDPDDVYIDTSEGEKILYSKWEQTIVLRKQGNIHSKDIEDGTVVVRSKTRDEYSKNPYIDTDVTNNVEYCYTVFAISDSNGVSIGVSQSVTPTDSDDPTGSPGNEKLLKGTMEEGYFGAVSSSDLISGDELARKVGVTQGTAQHSTTPWHKFAYKNKILFVAQKTIRKSISWDHLNDKNVVYGNKTIEIDGIKYKVRLLKGSLTDPSDRDSDDLKCKGSEWNRLVLPLHEERKNNSWGYPKYVEDDLQDWETYLSNSDMVVSSGGGHASWCQEVSSSTDSVGRVYRAYIGVSYSNAGTSSNTGSHFGWRPVLEVI